MRRTLAAPVLLLLAALLPETALAQDRSNPSFNLQNRGQDAVVELYATPSSNDRWGGDRLARFLVPPGTSFPVRLPAGSSCVYDIRVVFAGGRSEEMRRVDTCALENVAVPGAGRTAQSARPGNGGTTDDPSFRLVNRGRQEVHEVYASPAGEEEWGSDRLGDGVVAAGRTAVVRLPPGQCIYDVRVVWANGDATEKRKIDLCRITDFRVP